MEAPGNDGSISFLDTKQFPNSDNTTQIWPTYFRYTLQDVAVFCYEPMEFSDISSDLPDMMMTTTNDNIPGFVNISDSECMDNIQLKSLVCINIIFWLDLR